MEKMNVFAHAIEWRPLVTYMLLRNSAQFPSSSYSASVRNWGRNKTLLESQEIRGSIPNFGLNFNSKYYYFQGYLSRMTGLG